MIPTTRKQTPRTASKPQVQGLGCSLVVAPKSAADIQPNPSMMFQGIFFRSDAGGDDALILLGPVVIPGVYQTCVHAALSNRPSSQP
jgi:hypothetical protein